MVSSLSQRETDDLETSNSTASLFLGGVRRTWMSGSKPTPGPRPTMRPVANPSTSDRPAHAQVPALISPVTPGASLQPTSLKPSGAWTAVNVQNQPDTQTSLPSPVPSTTSHPSPSRNHSPSNGINNSTAGAAQAQLSVPRVPRPDAPDTTGPAEVSTAPETSVIPVPNPPPVRTNPVSPVTGSDGTSPVPGPNPTQADSSSRARSSPKALAQAARLGQAPLHLNQIQSTSNPTVQANHPPPRRSAGPNQTTLLADTRVNSPASRLARQDDTGSQAVAQESTDEIPSRPPRLETNGIHTKASPQPSDKTWSLWRQRLIEFKHSVLPSSSPILEPRLQLLHDACMSQDVLYLVLHQLYCRRFLNLTMPVWLRNDECEKGFRQMRDLLEDNRHLPREAILAFSRFPDSPQMLVGETWYSATPQEVVRFLRVLAHRFLSGHKPIFGHIPTRRYPPLVEELRLEFEVDTPVFMSVIFASLCRQLYDHVHLARLNAIFRKDLLYGQEVRPQVIEDYLAIPMKISAPTNPAGGPSPSQHSVAPAMSQPPSVSQPVHPDVSSRPIHAQSSNMSSSHAAQHGTTSTHPSSSSPAWHRSVACLIETSAEWERYASRELGDWTCAISIPFPASLTSSEQATYTAWSVVANEPARTARAIQCRSNGTNATVDAAPFMADTVELSHTDLCCLAGSESPKPSCTRATNCTTEWELDWCSSNTGSSATHSIGATSLSSSSTLAFISCRLAIDPKFTFLAQSDFAADTPDTVSPDPRSYGLGSSVYNPPARPSQISGQWSNTSSSLHTNSSAVATSHLPWPSQVTQPSGSQQPQPSALLPSQGRASMEGISPQQVSSPVGLRQAPISQVPPPMPLLPREGDRMPYTVHPNPMRLSLHQADLRDPLKKLLHRDSTGQLIETELFQYLDGFVLSPEFIDPKNCVYNWNFSLSAEECERFPRTIPLAAGSPPIREYQKGCRVFRLRCIAVANSESKTLANVWPVSNTTWPSVFYIHVNDIELQVRRKAHNGKDLPLDLTEHLHEGQNTIAVHLLLDPKECENFSYVFGIESMAIASPQNLRSRIGTISAADVRSKIQRRLSPSADDDDDLTVVTDSLTITLIDPFTAQIFWEPARSIHCEHLECFDLATFINTRRSVSGPGPMNDNWRCPICKADARPQCLIVDGFLAEVRTELDCRNQLDGAQAIEIKSDGQWEVKIIDDARPDTRNRRSSTSTPTKRKAGDAPDSSAVGSRPKIERPASGTPIPPPRPASEPMVIELD
ncbi:hypothetical protein N7492_008975 [Penicillium capsulatum]|uniref:SP-RING-type domain-containing protein n=1 Tax=Penicillium capsulatum TaxID=69766 RepID=A0A9W9HT07_9EURO|nr:hypothetical protein N7492_008975 [Penicillium capsulatum]